MMNLENKFNRLPVHLRKNVAVSEMVNYSAGDLNALIISRSNAVKIDAQTQTIGNGKSYQEVPKQV